MEIRNPVPILNEEQYEQWVKANMDEFDKLPAEVRACLREHSIEADCAKLNRAMALGVPVFMVVQEIELRARKQRLAKSRLN